MPLHTANESLNKADSSTLGPDQTWTEDFGDLQIVSNACRPVSANTVSGAQFTTGGGTWQGYETELTIKTFTTPSSGLNWIAACNWATTTQYAGVRISISSAGVCTVDIGNYQTGTGWTVNAGPVTITKPTAPFTLKSMFTIQGVYKLYVNNVEVLRGTGVNLSGSMGAMILFAQNTVSETEVDSVIVDDARLPMPLTSYTWPTHGIGWVGPFISSTGNVYVLGFSGTNVQMWKATDPASAFTAQTAWGVAAATSINVHKVGDVLHVIVGYSTAVEYRPWSMASDTWTQTALTVATVTPVNSGVAIAKRSTGSDVIAFYNTAGVVNMGKTYGRIAARRSAGGTAAFGAQTDIGIGTAATTLQPESVDSVLLASSDRIHLFWTLGNASASTASSVRGRCVKSTDNLGGTSPATAAYNVSTDSLGNVAAVEQVIHSSGQAFLSSGNVIAVPFCTGAVGIVAVATATDADTPTWSTTNVSSSAPLTTAVGATNRNARLGGAPYDGTNKTVAWIDGSLTDPYYDKDTGSGFGTDTEIIQVTAAQISSNVFTRGTNVVLASVYDNSGAFVYDEIILRTSGLQGSISPSTFTLTPVALATAVGDANRSLTNATFTLTPVALVRSVGGVTASISPVTMTLTPVALTTSGSVSISISPAIFTDTSVALTTSVGNANRSLTNATFTFTPVALTTTVGNVTASISPVTMTLTPVALTTSGSVSASISPAIMTLTPIALTASVALSGSISPAIFTLTPVALTSSIGGISTTLTPAIFTLNGVALTASVGGTSTISISPAIMSLTPVLLVRSVGGITTSVSPVTMTLTAITLVRGTDNVSYSITPVIMTLTAVALTRGSDNVARSVTPITMTLNAVLLSRGTDNVAYSVSPVTMTLTPVALVRSVGAISFSINSAIFTLNGVALTTSVGGTATSSISPAIFTLTAVTITGFSLVAGEGNILPAIFTLTPVALTRSVGPITSSISPATMTLNAVALVRGTDNIALTINPAQLVLTPIALVRSLGSASRGVTPVIMTLTPVALVRSIGTVSYTLTPVTMTFTPVALTRSLGTVNLTVIPVTMTFTAITLTYSVGATTYSISPVILTLIAVTLTVSGVGGKPKVWTDAEWVEKPVKYWTGTVWVEKPMKVWTGSTWELV
jgi:hypothetical protein